MGRIAARVDACQAEIVAALRKAGASVQSLAEVGRGCPDLLVARVDPETGKAGMFLLELKTGKAQPNELQQRWHISWNAPVSVVYTADDALRAIGILQ